jgi:hypothetical protein
MAHREIRLQRIYRAGRGVGLRREGYARIEKVIELDTGRPSIHGRF